MLSTAIRRLPAVVGRRAFASVANKSASPHVIRPSASEIASKRLDARNLEAAVRHLYLDGLVVVEDAIPQNKLDHLNVKMVEDAKALQARGKDGPFNYNQGNLQQDAPPVAEYFDLDVFAHPMAVQITSAVLGPQPKWTFCSANAAMPPLRGSSPQRQPVHSDADIRHPPQPFAFVVNVPLVTMTPDNGSTELWLGTQCYDINAQEGAHGERASGRIRQELLDNRAQASAPCQPIIKKGSFAIRDLRLWHAGMPNFTNDVRIMLAMIHFASWYRNPMRLEFGDDIKPILDSNDHGLEIPVDWVESNKVLKTYLNRGFGNSYNFDQTP